MLRLISFIAIAITTVSTRHVNFYRKDYVYVKEYDAFYKMHLDETGNNFASMFMACDDEGAELFFPEVMNEWMVAQKLLEEIQDAPNVTDIVVGVHDKFGLGEYVTVNGRPANLPIQNLDRTTQKCVTMNIETGAYETENCVAEPHSWRPFICKKVEGISCPTIDQGYRYVKETNKCYKVNKNLKTWTKAMETCYMEGGLLAVPGSEMEANIIRDFIESGDNYYAGFKKLFPNNEFYTVKGHKVQDSGFSRWYRDEYRDNVDCGYLWSNDQLYLRSITCDSMLQFICEMEVTA